MRVVTGAISHETSTFTPVPTTRENYQQRSGFLRGEAVLETFTGTNTPTGGFIDGARSHGFGLIPTIHTTPHPSGPTPREIFDEVVDELLDGVAAAGEVDGVLLELHGAMVAEGIDDCEGHILAAVRHLVGPGTPVLAQLDIHANVSAGMVEMADVLIGRETYPEIDMAARGRECADVLVRMHRDGLQPTLALYQIPMVWGMNQVTAHAPMREAIEALHRIEALPGVICGSIATCFPLADIPDMGASVYVATDNDPAMAERHARELGQWLYARRSDWHFPMPSTIEVLDRLAGQGPFPVVLADRNDNPGGGSPGDGTAMLRAFLERRLQKACILYIVDPEAVAACRAAGVGASVELDVGAKTTPLQGRPVRLTAEVMALSDGRFAYDGPMYAGLQGNMGPSAHIRQGGVHVLLVSEREQPFDTAFARTLSLDPKTMNYVGVKSAAHFRAAFEPFAGCIYVVAEPSVHSAETGHLTYQNLGRELYPLSTR